jgi:hypothetical protein
MDLVSPPSPRIASLAPSEPASLAGTQALGNLRLAGTASLGSLPADDPRLIALRRACALVEELEAERNALDRRLAEARRADPMRQASGRTSLDQAVEEARRLVRELDDVLCSAAESARAVATTHPKDPQP